MRMYATTADTTDASNPPVAEQRDEGGTVHLACKPEPTSAADTSGGHSGRRNIPRRLHNTVSMKDLFTSAASERYRRNSAEDSGRRAVRVRA
jgi:hypothetical protein